MGIAEAGALPGTAAPIDTAPLAEAAWLAAREERAARCHGRGFCPTRVAPYGSVDPYADRVDPGCREAGCLDLHHDLLVRMVGKLGPDVDLSDVRNPAAYAYRVASRELVELKRAERTAVGFPARPTRTDGAAGRVDAALAACGSPQGAWLVALFRIMRSYPFSPGHVPGRWPVDGLAEERSLYFPSEENHVTAVKSDIRVVLEHATRVAGHAWVHDNLILPLNASGTAAELPESRPVAQADDTHALMGRMLLERYLRGRAAGLDRRQALAVAAREVTGLGAPAHTRDIDQALDDIERAARSDHRLAG